MSFIQNIPEYHEAMVDGLDPIEDKIRDISFKLDAHDEAEEKGSHECDCEYCPYADADDKDLLDDLELGELHDQRRKLEVQLDEHRKAIKRLENYAKFVGKPLPQEVLIK